MKIRATWEGNSDGALRILSTKRGALRFWVLVQDEEGKPFSGECTLHASARDSRFMGWLRRVAPRARTRRAPSARLKVRNVTPGRAEFVVSGRPGRFFPYWIVLRAARSAVEREQVRIYAVPRLNRALSLLFVGCFALLLTYSSWLWLRLTSESLPDGIVTFAGTGSAVLAPLAALVAPVFSTTARRFVMDSLVSGASAMAALAAAVLLHGYQDPVYVENNTPAAVNAAGGGNQLLLEAGGATVIPRDELDRELQEFLACKRAGIQLDCPLPQNHWFSTGQYCLRDVVTDPERCLELRPANLMTQLQRWLAFGDIVRIGCNSVQGLDPDAIAMWKRSGSCKHDPELKVVRSLHEHLVRTMGKKAEAPEPCTEPSGEVTLHPFRASSRSTDASLPAKPVVLELLGLRGPDANESAPSWRFTSQGPLAELRTSAARDARGGPCQQPYLADCPTQRDGSCPGLFAPRGEVSVTLEQGDQKLGSLWCSDRAGRIFATRLMSRLLGLTVFAQDHQAFSQYTSISERPGGWVAWCEPGDEKGGAPGISPRPSSLVAEVMLPPDWQPVSTWTWELPAMSRIGQLDMVIKARGRWGTLSCVATSAARRLSLLNVNAPSGLALKLAMRGEASWTRYDESSPFPRWGWLCESAPAENRGQLHIELADGTRGSVNASGRFAPSSGEACLIDPVRITRVPGRPSARHVETARDVLLKFHVPNCDPARSFFAKERSTEAQ